MTIFTNVLYWISTGLLIPVIVFLLIAFVKALLMMGGFYGMYINRIKLKKNAKVLLIRLKKERIRSVWTQKLTHGTSVFTKCIEEMADINWKPIHCEKIISDFEIDSERELEASTTLMRVGPMLGLMGTLIPMGPALVGLASGDIESMAVNMQVAFSTTVVGIFVGIIGFVTQLVKRRWFAEDLNNLRYINELAEEENYPL